MKYLGALKKVKIICPEHGEFLQTPSDHKNGKGCYKCKLFNIPNFITKATITHGDKYDYSLTVGKTSKDKVKIICPEHGEFLQRASDHQMGKGCPSCANCGFKKNEKAIMYYLEINNGEAYKIGITGSNVKRRFSKDLSKIKILKTWGFKKGIDAYNKEQSILKEFKYAKYTGHPLLHDGNSELFDRDILLLA